VEKYFPSKNVRYIAVNDGIDTFQRNNGNNEMGAFKAVVNDMYARDISKKVRTAKRTQAEKGEFVGAFPVYGYKKDPLNKNKIVVDEDVVENVKFIFNEYLKGNGATYIANRLNEKGIMCPSIYKQNSCKFHCKTLNGLWGHGTITKMLRNRTYIGELTQHKGEIISYKVKKYKLLPKEEHITIFNAHEAIIDKKIFDTVQDLLKLKSRHKPTGTDKKHLLTGLIRCSKCGARYQFVRQQGLHDDMVAVCSVYNRYGKEYCERIAIRESVMNKAVIDDLKRLSKENLSNDDIINLQEIKGNVGIKEKIKKDIFNSENRISQIDKIIKVSYEDRVTGVLSSEEFVSVTSDYRKERENLLLMIKELRDKLNFHEENNTSTYIDLINNIKNFEDVTKDILIKLVDKIEIISSEKIKIYYRFSE